MSNKPSGKGAVIKHRAEGGTEDLGKGHKNKYAPFVGPRNLNAILYWGLIPK